MKRMMMLALLLVGSAVSAQQATSPPRPVWTVETLPKPAPLTAETNKQPNPYRSELGFLKLPAGRVMGSTSAEACGTYIFAIDWGHLFTDQQGSIGGGGAADPLSAILGMLPIGGPSPEAARALYDAIEKMPEATNIYAPKVHEHVTGFSPFGQPVFGKRCATVEAHGVKLGTGPVPNAN